MTEKLHINKLIEKSKTYREGKVLETIQSDEMVIFLVDGREKRPIIDVGSASESTKEVCPYCQEAIPCAHLGEIADWHITGNKYPGTNVEVIAVSKEHSPYLKNTDFRAWMHMSIVTNSTLMYSPARKSLPGHKHIQLLDFNTNALSKAKVEPIDDSVGYTPDYKYRMMVVNGDFETRLDKTVSILRKLYIKEHMYNIVIKPDVTYILPSKIVGRMLDARVFIGIVSTTDKNLFEDIKNKINKGEGSKIITDYSDCNYEENELIDLVKETSLKLPKIKDTKDRLDTLGANLGAVLALGDNNIVSGLNLANGLNIEFQSSDFAFTTDKKSNFFPDCIPPVFQNLKDRDLLVIVDKLTKNIENYILLLKKHYGVSKIYSISSVNEKDYNIEEITNDQLKESVSKPETKIEANLIDEGQENSFLKEQIEGIKEMCKKNPFFVEMVICLDIKNVEDVSNLQKEFLSASIKIMPFNEKDDWKTNDDYIRNNITPTLRDFNPATSKLLEYVADSYKDIIISQSKHKCEEGIIVLYIGNSDLVAETETYQNFINMLAMNTGREIHVITDKKLNGGVTLKVTQENPQTNFSSLKPGSEVVILEDKVIKKMINNELETYMLLRRYSDRLHNEKITIITPELLDYDKNSHQGLISKISNFSIYSPREYFGLTEIYNTEYYKILYEVTEIIRNNIPSHEVFSQLDHEIGSEGKSKVINTIESDFHGGEDPKIIDLGKKVKKMLGETQDYISDLPLFPGHRDPNPNNYKITHEGEKISVSLVDWETFGLSRRGYEEGRFMACLALDVLKQNDYSKFITSNLNKNELIYFWRTVAARTLHEIASVLHGLYDARLIPTVKNIDEVQKNKQQFVVAFNDLANRALNEINIIIKQK